MKTENTHKNAFFSKYLFAFFEFQMFAVRGEVLLRSAVRPRRVPVGHVQARM